MRGIVLHFDGTKVDEFQGTLRNPSFEEGVDPWRFYTNGKGSFTTVDDAMWGAQAARIEIVKPGSNVQLYQARFQLKPKTTYHLRFAAKSSNGNDMDVLIHKHGSPYTNYGLRWEGVELTDKWDWYDMPFTTKGFSEPVNDARIRFWFAPYDEADMSYHIDHVMLYEVSGYVPPSSTGDLPTTTVPTEGYCDPTPGNLLRNPGFEAGTDPWRLYASEGGSFTTASPAFECAAAARVVVDQPGSNIQLYQAGIALEPDTAYRLRLAAKSSNGEDLSLFLHQHDAPNANYGLNGVVMELTEQWQVREVRFTTTDFGAPVTDGRLRLWLAPFAQAGTTYWIDDVVLIKEGATQSAMTAASAEVGAPITPAISGYFIDDDDAGREAGNEVEAELNHPPVCAGAYASPDTLWPVNHKFVPIEILGVTDPDGGPVTIMVTSIMQDEPVSGLGSGDQSPDGAGVGSSTAEVRAERSGQGNGRVYHIGFTAQDGQGGACVDTVQVTVPHDQGGGAVDEGALHDSVSGADAGQMNASEVGTTGPRIYLPLVERRR